MSQEIIGFKDLSGGLKIAVISAWIFCGVIAWLAVFIAIIVLFAMLGAMIGLSG